MAGANNKQMKAAGMSAKAVEHVRATQGVVSSLASATKAAKRAGKPASGEAGKKLARPAPKVTWGEKVAASRKKSAEAFSVSSLMKSSAADNGRKGADSFSVANLMKRSEGAQSRLPPLRERNRNMYIDESTRSKPGKLPPLRAAK